MGNTRNIDELQRVLDAWSAGDTGPTMELFADGVVFENGPAPGADRWPMTEGKDAFFERMMTFASYFGGTLRQEEQRCIYADDRIAVVTFRDRATLPNGDEYDTRPVMISRFDEAGRIDRLWVVEVDVEKIDSYFSDNPLIAAPQPVR